MQGVNAYNYFNTGVGSITCAQLASGFATRVPKINTASKFNVYSIQCGVNDYVGGTTVAATVYASLMSNVTAAQALGYQVIVWTLEDNSITSNAFRAAYNLLITNGAAGSNYTVANIGADANMGCNGCSSNLTYFRDGVHPTIVGNGVYGVTYLKPALVSLGWN